MTDLERAVLAEMVRLNTPITKDDAPYPASLMPIVRAVIEAVRSHEDADIRRDGYRCEAGCFNCGHQCECDCHDHSPGGIELTQAEADAFQAALSDD